MEDGEGEPNETASRSRGKGVIGRPRGSKRTRGPRTAKGGLFRDFRPQLWDTPGADIRAGSTPESWDQLSDGGGGGVGDERYTSNMSASPLWAASASPIPPPFRPARSALASEETVVPADDVEMDDDI